MHHTIRSPLLAVLVLLAVWAAPQARADVILTPSDGGGAFVGPTEGAFTITATTSAMIYGNASQGVYSGYTIGAAWTIAATDGRPFTFSGLDAEALGWGPPLDLVLIGTPADAGSAIVTDLSSPGIAVLPASFIGVNLVSLTISGFGYDDGGFDMTGGFNNVTVNEVPEPTSGAILAIGLACLRLISRRRRVS